MTSPTPSSASRRIDLRSDTVTQPTADMRAAIAAAPVGDDVFGEDPTVIALQERAATLLGTEAALYVPSGTMANQIAILAHTRPGDDVLVGEFAHSYLYESGGGGAIAGVQFSVLGRGGLFTAADVRAAIHPPDHHFAPTSLIIAENSHNRSGGTVFPLEELRAIRAVADEHGLAFHIDGARLLNAAVASGTPPATYGGVAHSLSLCLSKGLGAPVGSVIAGSRALVARAHRYRKMLGGGMRQAGIIAAAGLYALEHHVERLAEDHARARAFAEGVATIPGLRIDPARVHTNIVVFEVEPGPLSAAQVAATATARGLAFMSLGPTNCRAVFHLHIGDDDVARGLEILRGVMTGG